MSGIYMIRCRENGWYYIGSTELRFEDRFDRHRSQMERGKAPRLLQACHDLHGGKGFDFVPLYECPAAEVAAREREAIATLKPDLNVYHNPLRKRVICDRPAIRYPVRGMMLTLTEISDRFGIGRATLRKRIERGLTGEGLIAGLHCAPRKPYGS